jgi:hypothetical protein
VRVFLCGKGLVLFWLLWVLSLPAFGQSFDPEATYEVTGAWLNERETESRMANEALRTAKNENEGLRKEIESLSLDLKEAQKKSGEQLTQLSELREKLANESKDRLMALTEVSRQLSEASRLLKNSQDEALRNSLVVGGVSAGVASVLTALAFLLH